MGTVPHTSEELAKIYSKRFDEHLEYRNRVWEILTAQFFSKFISSDSRVLDLGCGYGEFINNMRCAQPLAMDMNPTARKYLKPDVVFLEQDCSQTWKLPANHLDAVFTSNFFEHLPSKSSLSETLSQAQRCLKPGGVLIAMGPNARFVGGAYWDFWDHHLALTDQSIIEGLSLNGFQTVLSIARFLPYTMVNKRSVPMTFVSLYLKIPLLWWLFGKQFLVVARKSG
jgi:SAM-dependent methyltransferase